MRILLINPSSVAESGRDLYSAHLLGPLFTLQPATRMTLGIPLALPTLAAVTPRDHQIRIVDEEIEDIDFDEQVDLVGLTAMTFKAKRAYEIAKRFRQKGVKVVIGGIHASMCPDEAAKHVDSVVIGEADDLWPLIVSDAAAGQLKDRYHVQDPPDLGLARVPRFDLVRNRSYLYAYLQTTRGCPYDCNFCTVTQMSGRKIRKKTSAQVVSEVDALLKLSPLRPFNILDKELGVERRFVGMIAFIDDNFAIDRDHALKICHSLRKYQSEQNILFFWYTQVNYSVGLDEDLLSAMAAAGCRHLFIGFENLDPDALKSMNKKMNRPEDYERAIENIERHGLRVVFSTIIGDDSTSFTSAKRLIQFIQKNHVFHVLLNILTPYPGTALFEEVEREGRLLSRDSSLYNIRNVVFQPRRISVGELKDIYTALCNHLFTFDNVYSRGQKSSHSGDRFCLPVKERLLMFCGLNIAVCWFLLKKRVRWRMALRLLYAIPGTVLKNGSFFALENLLSSVDYDDFATSELSRLEKSKQNNVAL